MDALRAKGGTYISAQFTLVPGPNNEPLIAPHLKELRPFLGKGDFAPGKFGHNLVDALAPADYTIEKVAYSALYQTRLEYILRALDIDTLIIAGSSPMAVSPARCGMRICGTCTRSCCPMGALRSNKRCMTPRCCPLRRFART